MSPLWSKYWFNVHDIDILLSLDFNELVYGPPHMVVRAKVLEEHCMLVASYFPFISGRWGCLVRVPAAGWKPCLVLAGASDGDICGRHSSSWRLCYEAPYSCGSSINNGVPSISTPIGAVGWAFFFSWFFPTPLLLHNRWSAYGDACLTTTTIWSITHTTMAASRFSELATTCLIHSRMISPRYWVWSAMLSPIHNFGMYLSTKFSSPTWHMHPFAELYGVDS
jgi:hypothetical protein